MQLENLNTRKQEVFLLFSLPAIVTLSSEKKTRALRVIGRRQEEYSRLTST